MALPDELSAANIAILVSKSAAEAARMKLAYGALFRINRFCNDSTAPDVKYPEMQCYKIDGQKFMEVMEEIQLSTLIQLVKLISFKLNYFLFDIFAVPYYIII